MMKRTKGEQKAYLDGYEMCADCIEKYLTDEGKQKIQCLIKVVRDAIEVDKLEVNVCDNCKTPCIMYEKGMRGCGT